MKASDRRLTPPDLLAAARAMGNGHIALDPCTEPDNPTEALAHYALPQNGLDADWRAVAERAAARARINAPAIVWCNPPWSARIQWDMAAGLYGRGLTAVLVFSCVDFTAPWWRTLCRVSARRCELSKRPKCLDPTTGKRMDVARSGAVWLVSDREELAASFADAWGHLGAIVTPGSHDGAALAALQEVGRAAE